MDRYPDPVRPFPGLMSIEHEGDRQVLCLRGDVDTAVAERFKAHHGRAPVVDAIDAAEVSFMSSTALAVLLRCSEASLAAGRHAVLRASSPAVERILRLSGLAGAIARPPTEPDHADP
jgi:anti-anti-sigma factor